MFSISCPYCDREVLLSTHELTAMTDTPNGIVVEFDCVCGASGVYIAGAATATKRLIYHQHAPVNAEAA